MFLNKGFVGLVPRDRLTVPKSCRTNFFTLLLLCWSMECKNKDSTKQNTKTKETPTGTEKQKRTGDKERKGTGQNHKYRNPMTLHSSMLNCFFELDPEC